MARPREFNEETVLDAAMNLFWTQGYDATSLAELLDAMGLQRGSLYKAWGSKRGLFMAVLDRYDALHIAPGIAFLEGAGDAASMSAENRIAASFSNYDDRGCLMCNAAGGVAGTDGEIARWIDERMTRLAAAYETALREMGEIDTVARRTRSEELARRYVGMRIAQRVGGGSAG